MALPHKLNDVYNKLSPRHYDEGGFFANPIRKSFLRGRYRQTNTLVHLLYHKGAKLVDMGCGLCSWNVDRLPVYGIDINENILQLAKQRKRLYDYKVTDVESTGFPDDSCNIVVVTEVLEHITDYRAVIGEIHRILKPGGKAVISVPYGVFFSLWWPAFWFRVLISGYIFGDAYFRRGMGHVHLFSKESIKTAFESNGFSVDKVSVYFGATVFLVATRL